MDVFIQICACIVSPLSLSFLNITPGFFPPLHLHAFALILVVAGIHPDCIEFQLQRELGHFQFLV